MVKEPYSEYGLYSYADYLTWEIDHMVELIKGKVFKQAAAAQEESIRRSLEEYLQNCTSNWKKRMQGLLSPLRRPPSRQIQ
jgi:FtsZ-binding cell division protein ZapB